MGIAASKEKTTQRTPTRCAPAVERVGAGLTVYRHGYNLCAGGRAGVVPIALCSCTAANAQTAIECVLGWQARLGAWCALEPTFACRGLTGVLGRKRYACYFLLWLLVGSCRLRARAVMGTR